MVTLAFDEYGFKIMVTLAFDEYGLSITDLHAIWGEHIYGI